MPQSDDGAVADDIAQQRADNPGQGACRENLGAECDQSHVGENAICGKISVDDLADGVEFIPGQPATAQYGAEGHKEHPAQQVEQPRRDRVVNLMQERVVRTETQAELRTDGQCRRTGCNSDERQFGENPPWRGAKVFGHGPEHGVIHSRRRDDPVGLDELDEFPQALPLRINPLHVSLPCPQ